MRYLFIIFGSLFGIQYIHTAIMIFEKKAYLPSPTVLSSSSRKSLLYHQAFVWVLSVLATLVFLYPLYSLLAFYIIHSQIFQLICLPNHERTSGPIGAPYTPTFLNNGNPSSLQFSVKHVFHQNVDRPISNAMMGRLDINHSTLAKLCRDTEYTTYGSESVSPWDSIFSIAPKYNHPVTRLEDRSPEYIQSYIHYTHTHHQRNLPEIKSQDLAWVDEEIAVPNVTDKDTIVSLAIMSANAYVDIPYTGAWQNVTGNWSKNNTFDFGWKNDGIRGHVFLSEETSQSEAGAIVVIAIKGTSAAIWDNGGDTAPKDKINDNMLFSCCCARVNYLWNPVCDCFTGKSYTCNQNCLERELYREDRYYKGVVNIYNQVQKMYPNSQIWVTGHSLGGALAVLLGRTYGLPVVAFEAPGELLAAKRLHLPIPPKVSLESDHVWHFGHTADPIYLGNCNGVGSYCSVAGYAMESVCHSGLECTYDVVKDFGWHVNLLNHRIHVVIDEVLLVYNSTAECKVPPACQDCADWKFVSDADDGRNSVSSPPKASTDTTTHSVIQPSTAFFVTAEPTSIASPTLPVTTILSPTGGDRHNEPESPK